MRVAFMTYSFSMHINIKAKYFMRPDDYVYFFAMHPRRKMRGHDVAVRYRENMHVKQLVHEGGEWEQILKNTLEIYQILKKNSISILHIIDMTFAVYGITLGMMGVKIVLENNGSDVLLAPDEPGTRRRYKLAYKLSKAVVQDSEVAKRAGIALGANKRMNEIVELGIDTKIFNPNVKRGVFRQQYQIPKDAKVIFSPRTLRPLCNINEIIDTIAPVLSKYPNTYYVFCSSMNDKKYENRIRKDGFEKHVIFLGYVDNEKEMPYIYRDADIVLSIPNSDSSPRSVYEAMACGSNVIVTDLPWIGEKFSDKRELFVVPLHDMEKLIGTINNILEGKEKIDEWAEFSRVRQILDYLISERKLRKIYFSILKQRRRFDGKKG